MLLPCRSMSYAKKVLVVDDEEMIREVLSMQVNFFGYDVICAKTGDEALDIYQHRKDEIGLILMDNNMIKENEGLETTKKIRELEKQLTSARLHLPIISISGDGAGIYSEEFRKEAKDSGIDDFCPKPLDLKKIENLITKYKLAA